MWMCGLNSLVDDFDVETRDVLEGKCDNKEGDLKVSMSVP